MLVEVRRVRLGFLGKLGVDDLAVAVGEERGAAVFAVLRGEGAGELLHLIHAALGALKQPPTRRPGARIPARAPVGRPTDAVRAPALAADAKADPILVDAFFADPRHHRVQLARFRLERILEEGDRRADAEGAHATV